MLSGKPAPSPPVPQEWLVRAIRGVLEKAESHRSEVRRAYDMALVHASQGGANTKDLAEAIATLTKAGREILQDEVDFLWQLAGGEDGEEMWEAAMDEAQRRHFSVLRASLEARYAVGGAR